MKKIVSLCLVVVMICSMFAGCGKSQNSKSVYKDEPDEKVVLTLALMRGEQEDTEKVVAEINKRLETLLPNTEVEFMLDDSMADKWALWMSTKKKIDIAHSGYIAVLEEEVNKETYLELDELVADYAPNIQKLQKKYWNAYDNATVQGSLYAIPNMQSHVRDTLVLALKAELKAYMDFKAMKKEAWSSDKTTEQFYVLLTEGLNKAKAAGVDCNGIASLSLYDLAKRGYTFVGGENSNLCYDNSDQGKIIDFYTTEEFATFCKYMKTWADSGYVSKDILTGQWSDGFSINTKSHYNEDPETALLQEFVPDHLVYFALDNPENRVLTTDIGEQMTYYSIPYTSEHPARAMRFLDLLNSEEGAEILNLLAYGIEGEHYEFTDKENGDIRAFEYEAQGNRESSYGIPNWIVGNMMEGMYNCYPYTHEYKEYAKNYYENTLSSLKKHVLYGCSFDTDSIQNQLNQLVKNNAEYAESIYSGIVNDGETLLKDLMEKNKVAGQEDIVKELQKQADEFIASK